MRYCFSLVCNTSLLRDKRYAFGMEEGQRISAFILRVCTESDRQQLSSVSKMDRVQQDAMCELVHQRA